MIRKRNYEICGHYLVFQILQRDEDEEEKLIFKCCWSDKNSLGHSRSCSAAIPAFYGFLTTLESNFNGFHSFTTRFN